MPYTFFNFSLNYACLCCPALSANSSNIKTAQFMLSDSPSKMIIIPLAIARLVSARISWMNDWLEKIADKPYRVRLDILYNGITVIGDLEWIRIQFFEWFSHGPHRGMK
jgi:hypothetical protein